jgi:hypothetical protein
MDCIQLVQDWVQWWDLDSKMWVKSLSIEQLSASVEILSATLLAI